MSALVAGLAFGLLGSGHCALMCGPLAALPVARASIVGYHLGRVLTYMGLGLAAGAIGAGASWAGAGRVLAVISGLCLIAMAVAGPGSHLGTGPVGAGVRGLLSRLARRASRHPRMSGWLFGAANALLPCGLLYAAVVAGAGFGSMRDAVVFLAAFGLGTVPLLAMAGRLGPALAAALPARKRALAPIALALVGALLILRGTAGGHLHDPAPAREHVHDQGQLTAR